MKAGGRVTGILNVSTAQPIPFAPREVELLQAIGNIIGVAVENARLFGETRRSLERVRTLVRLGYGTPHYETEALVEGILER